MNVYRPADPNAVKNPLEHPTVTGLAARYGKTPAQVVLRWHIEQGVVAIPKSVKPHRIKENFGVFDFRSDSRRGGIDRRPGDRSARRPRSGDDQPTEHALQGRQLGHTVAAAKESDRVLPEHHTLDRSSLIRGTLLGATGLFVGGGLSNWSGQARAETERDDEHDRTPANRILLVYFSRAGENYYYGGRRDLKIGNTEVLAGMISKQIRVDMHRIRAAQPYPHSYQRTVSRNVREQNADARPRIANPLTSIERYDVVLLGSPIWNVRPPMIMSTFTDSHDFERKTIYPFVTYAVSGLGTTAEVYTASCPNATIGEGLAVRGERVRGADRAVESWLRRINLLR